MKPRYVFRLKFVFLVQIKKKKAFLYLIFVTNFRLKVAMSFNPADSGDGILMYCSQSDEGLGDFAALIIKDKHVEFRYDIGSGMATIRSPHAVQPGVWTRVTVNRDHKDAKLAINDQPVVVEGKTPGASKTMTLNTPLYIGGVDRRRIAVNEKVGIDQNFRGCVSEVRKLLARLLIKKKNFFFQF